MSFLVCDPKRSAVRCLCGRMLLGMLRQVEDWENVFMGKESEEGCAPSFATPNIRQYGAYAGPRYQSAGYPSASANQDTTRYQF